MRHVRNSFNVHALIIMNLQYYNIIIGLLCDGSYNVIKSQNTCNTQVQEHDDNNTTTRAN